MKSQLLCLSPLVSGICHTLLVQWLCDVRKEEPWKGQKTSGRRRVGVNSIP